MPGLAVVALFVAAVGEELAGVADHVGAAAEHEAVVLDRHVRQSDILEQLARGHQVGDPAAVAERLAGHGRVVDQLRADHLAQKFVLRKALGDGLAVGKLLHLPAAVDEHDLFEALVGFRVLDDRQEGREAGAGPEEVEILARQQVVEHQRTGGLLADDDRIADLEVLQLGRKRPGLDLDGEELEFLLVIGRHHAVGPQQRPALDLDADHRELAVPEAESRIARRAEGEERVGPVVDRQNALLVELAHRLRCPESRWVWRSFRRCGTQVKTRRRHTAMQPQLIGIALNTAAART